MIRAYVATLLAFAALDAAWLVLVAVRLFQAELGAILNPSPNLGAILAFYPIYAFGIVWLAVRPALGVRSAGIAAGKGAILGLCAYATFDLTGLAVIRGWTLQLALIDMAWGTALSAVAALAGYAAGHSYSRSAPDVRPR